MTPERLDHMTVQYVWGLENDQAFVLKAKHEVERGNFSQFRRLVGRHIHPIRLLLGESSAGALSGIEWSFLYLEMWNRLLGTPYQFTTSNDRAEFGYQLDRLNEAGYALTPRGVQKANVYQPAKTNPCVEIVLGDPQPCTLQPLGEDTMNDNYAKSPCATATLAPAFETKSYIFGNDVKNMTEEGLISAIKRVEEQIADLKAVKTKSKKIAANVAKLEEALASIVAELDAR